jgi:hypothetical protein
MALLSRTSTKRTVIDGDDLANALSDPKVSDLIASAVAYGSHLHAAGKDHSVDLGDDA